MILYLDTSSLVKLYLQENGSEDMDRLVASAYSVSTSWLTYTETRATFARRLREKNITELEYHTLLLGFEKEWGSYEAIEVTTSILRRAADLAATHRMRALDAIHLASAIDADLGGSLVFSSSDVRLVQAAKAAGLRTPS